MQKSGEKSRRSAPRSILTWLLLIAVCGLAGCSALPFDLPLPWVQQTEELGLPTVSVVDPSSTALTPTPETTPSPEKTPTDLVLWLPVELDPQGEGQAAQLLQNRLDAFAESEGIAVNVRVKELSGPAGLLDALTAANAAAPDALPDLIVLNRKDLETAALKSLVYPLDSLTSIVDGEDWYPYGRNLSLIQNVVYGIPFVGDPLALAYKQAATALPLQSWEGLAQLNGTFLFAADDPQASLALTMYLADGGKVEDNQRYPILEEEVLTRTLTFLRDLNTAGKLDPASLQLSNPADVWEEFALGAASAVPVASNQFLGSLSQTEEAQALTSLAESPLTTSSGWVWVVSTPQALRQALAVRLAENLVEPGFLAAWSEALGRLPVRISALAAWQNATYKTALSKLSLAAVLNPSNETLSSIAPALHTAVISVLRDGSDPQEAAIKAVESLK